MAVDSNIKLVIDNRFIRDSVIYTMNALKIDHLISIIVVQSHLWKDVDKENFDFDLTILIGNLYELYNWFYALLNSRAAYITYRDTTESLIHSVDMLERNNYFLSAVTKKCLKMTIFERQKYFLVEYIKKELTKSELAILDILGKGYSKKK